jgi:hypothetical protein
VNLIPVAPSGIAPGMDTWWALRPLAILCRYMELRLDGLQSPSQVLSLEDHPDGMNGAAQGQGVNLRS